ncbi:MAG TPA: hypothetical protein VIA62_29730 [Thermoanaerobaculia bacterium]|jgi:hypothetical protein|nr:hypothetical protein [Thermoanaerobaculia bacterium]
MRTPKRILTLALLVVGGLVVQTGAALACTDACVRVDDPNHPFCRQCEDTGAYTGATCENIGNCGCAYTHNTCGLSASGIKADVQQADLGILLHSGDGAVCPATASGDVAR